MQLKGNLRNMSDRLGEVTDMLLKLEEINDEQNIELSKLQLQNAKLQQQLDDKNQFIEENRRSFEKSLEQYKTETNEVCTTRINFITPVYLWIKCFFFFFSDERTIDKIERRNKNN